MIFRNLSGTAGLFYSSQEHRFLGRFLFSVSEEKNYDIRDSCYSKYRPQAPSR